jgi:hypothetical protein
MISASHGAVVVVELRMDGSGPTRRERQSIVQAVIDDVLHRRNERRVRPFGSFCHMVCPPLSN